MSASSRWLDPSPTAVPDALREQIGGHPLIAEVLVRRGIRTADAARAFLDASAYAPASPSALPDVKRAVARIRSAIRQHEPICIWGDFDVDGQTSTALLVSALRDLGANVDYHIPNRQSEGHGIDLPVLRRILDAGAKLILTCDTGISAHEAVDYAQTRGVDVLITDHHNLPPTLPNAAAVVNPKRLPTDHPLHELPGVGVAYKLIEALAGEQPALLDLVALGIVADVALQVRDTRYLLQRGLMALRATQRLGLQAIFELAEINPAQITEEHIGFTLAPRLNALGRLDDANLAVELLTTRDLERARLIAQRLESLNAQRKLLVDQVYSAAQAQIERDSALLETNVLILAHPQWHSGVLGIVATRLVEQYRRPVILLVSPPGEAAHGSARSVEGVDITAALSTNAALLTSFGGHAMAAGLSLPPENISALRRALSRAIALPTSETTLTIDGCVELSALSLAFAADLERLAPFGAGNPPLILSARDLTIRNHRMVGRSGEHRQITVADAQGQVQRVLWWQSGDLPLPTGHFDLAFSVRAVDYRGEQQLQLEWIDSRPAAGVVSISKPALEIVDYRSDPDPLARLRELSDVLVWREADPQMSGQTRLELTPARALAIWTIPPGSSELHRVLEQVQPEIVYLFASDPALDTLEAFLKRLAGLVKYAINRSGGTVTLTEFAAATAQREITVQAGLDWLTARGQLTVTSADPLVLAAGTGQVAADLAQAQERLIAHLRETAAYRAFYRRADPARLVADPL